MRMPHLLSKSLFQAGEPAIGGRANPIAVYYGRARFGGRARGEQRAGALPSHEERFSAASIMAQLGFATGVDLAAVLPVLEGDLAGETLVFVVGGEVGSGKVPPGCACCISACRASARQA